jgi:hypothetical protein
MTRLGTLVSVVFLTVASGASSQQATDPYAADYTKRQRAGYARHKAEFLDNMRAIYFAIGCKVLPDEAYAFRLINSLANAISQEGIAIGIYDGPAERMAASREGLARAQREGCAYWHDNPDSVLALRQAAEQAH